MTTTDEYLTLADLKLPPSLYRAWAMGRDAAESGLPADADPFPQLPWTLCGQCYTAWLLGYTGASLDLAVPAPRHHQETTT